MAAPRKHELQIELGSSHQGKTYAATCEPCGWVGPDRRTTEQAEEDFQRHQDAVEGERA